MQPGTTLGPYEILSPIGAGGMGEVYKARDTRLDRTVAIKVLPEHVAADPDLKQRFEREAKTISSLNHPHICTLYDIGTQDGIDFLVMEYLEGDTLAQRLEKGALPLDQALKVAIEIADALDKAHRQGITHRDLKPGNIMLTTAGAKLLDFGLAKLRKPGMVGGDGFSAATTLSEPLTARGTILGTLPYMAPEQVEGKDTDARTDVFAFGAIVYEMVTGTRVFRGDSQASLIAAILGSQPNPMSMIEPLSPVALDRVVTKCLAKDPDDRWHTAHDLTDELKWITHERVQPIGSSTADVRDELAPVAAVPATRDRILVGIGAAVGLILMAAVVVWWSTSLSEFAPRTVTRTTLTFQANQGLVRTQGFAPLALSPDGARVVYASSGSGTRQLYLRELDRFDVTTLPGTEGAQRPFFSPDGEWVGFFADGLLQKVAIAGGLPVTICDAPVVGRGASWGPEDTIIFQPGAGLPGLLRVSAGGGEPEPLKTADAQMDQSAFAWPSFLPDGSALLTTLNYGTRDPQLFVLSLESGEWKLLGDGGHARYAPPGYLIYYDETRGGLQAVAFDVARLEVLGSPVSVVDSVYRAPSVGAPFFEVSLTGSLVYLSGGLDRSLMWVDRRGQGSPAVDERRGFRFPALSPDGTKVAVNIDPRPSELWVYDLERGTRIQLAGGTHRVLGGVSPLSPLWSPDGGRLVFSAVGANLYWMPADGSSDAEALVVSDHRKYPYSWSSDGRFLTYQELHSTTGADIWVLPLDGNRTPEPFLVTPASEAYLRFSPNGRWVAYISAESGRSEVYVRPFPGPAGAIPISTDGGTLPVWSADGRELYYRNGDTMMVVTVNTGAIFAAGTPEVLFNGAYNNINNDYDVSADGRFLMVRPDPNATADRLQVVLNWVEELTARVPTN